MPNKKPEFTHVGKALLGATNSGVIVEVTLRETKLHYVDARGRRFKKSDGCIAGSERHYGAPTGYRLDVTTVRALKCA